MDCALIVSLCSGPHVITRGVWRTCVRFDLDFSHTGCSQLKMCCRAKNGVMEKTEGRMSKERETMSAEQDGFSMDLL